VDSNELLTENGSPLKQFEVHIENSDSDKNTALPKVNKFEQLLIQHLS
jgi:hypothetical protein